jgi:hypothetical protein
MVLARSDAIGTEETWLTSDDVVVASSECFLPRLRLLQLRRRRLRLLLLPVVSQHRRLPLQHLLLQPLLSRRFPPLVDLVDVS